MPNLPLVGLTGCGRVIAVASMMRLAKADLFRLFLILVFPTHFWAILVFFLNAPSVNNRNDLLDLLSILAYILVLTLLECIAQFGVLLLLSLLTPKSWPPARVAAFLTAVYALVVCWAALAQIGGLIPIPHSASFTWLAINLANTAAYWQIATALAYLLPALLSIYILRQFLRGNWVAGINKLAEQTILLSYMYLLFDAAAMLWAIARNAT